jgi:hypothetical protein
MSSGDELDGCVWGTLFADDWDAIPSRLRISDSPHRIGEMTIAKDRDPSLPVASGEAPVLPVVLPLNEVGDKTVGSEDLPGKAPDSSSGTRLAGEVGEIFCELVWCGRSYRDGRRISWVTCSCGRPSPAAPIQESGEQEVAQLSSEQVKPDV